MNLLTHSDYTVRELYRAILADPDNDSLRFVIADRLEECGECAQAEFIRLQMELTTLTPFSHEMHDRANELLRELKPRWIGSGFSRGLTFVRGFSEILDTRMDIWYRRLCNTCGGYGWVEGASSGVERDNAYACRVCDGDGSILGIGPKYVGRFPLKRVNFKYMLPAYIPSVSMYQWRVGNPVRSLGTQDFGTKNDYVSSLPEEIYAYLPRTHHVALRWETLEQAFTAASTASLLWARKVSNELAKFRDAELSTTS